MTLSNHGILPIIIYLLYEVITYKLIHLQSKLNRYVIKRIDVFLKLYKTEYFRDGVLCRYND